MGWKIGDRVQVSGKTWVQKGRVSSFAKDDPTVPWIVLDDGQSWDARDLGSIRKIDERKPMKFWLDTEFIDDGVTIDLLSIGIVAEDGREYYAVSSEADWSKASQWVKVNVLPHLDRSIAKSRSTIREELKVFFQADLVKPEIWGYYADYDWVVFCQLFGRMIDLPEGFPMYCRDLKQLCDDLGNPKLPEQKSNEHHALYDARWNKEAWEFCVKVKEGAAR